jgi:hypothetical protein
MKELKELSAIEKLQAVKTAMEAFGYDFDHMTVSEAFDMFRKINKTIQNTTKQL